MARTVEASAMARIDLLILPLQNESLRWISGSSLEIPKRIKNARKPCRRVAGSGRRWVLRSKPARGPDPSLHHVLHEAF